MPSFWSKLSSSSSGKSAATRDELLLVSSKSQSERIEYVIAKWSQESAISIPKDLISLIVLFSSYFAIRFPSALAEDALSITSSDEGDKEIGRGNILESKKPAYAMSDCIFQHGLNAFRVKIDKKGYMITIGFIKAGASTEQLMGWYPGQDEDSYGYRYNGNKCHAGRRSYGEPFSTGDVIKGEVDYANGTIEFFKNNLSQGIAFESINFPLRPAIYLYKSKITVIDDSYPTLYK